MLYGPDECFSKWIYDAERLEHNSPLLATHWLTFGYLPMLPLRRAVVIPDVVTLKPANPVRRYYEQKLALGYMIVEKRHLKLKEILFTYFCRWVLGSLAFLFDLIAVTVVFLGGGFLIFYSTEVVSESGLSLSTAGWILSGLLVLTFWGYCIFNQERLLHAGFRRIEHYESVGLRKFAEQEGQT